MSISRNTTQNKNHKKSKKGSGNLFQIIISSVAIGILSFFAASLILAFALSKMPDPDSLILPSAVIMSILSGLSGGFCSSKMSGRPMPYSLVCGLFMVLVYLVISLFFSPYDFDNGMIFKTATILSLPISSVAGGFLADKKHKKNSKTNKSSARYR
jgi:putative membrane protein (TIGR04086 family)